MMSLIITRFFMLPFKTLLPALWAFRKDQHDGPAPVIPNNDPALWTQSSTTPR
jgi:hypothetical protein